MRPKIKQKETKNGTDRHTKKRASKPKIGTKTVKKRQKQLTKAQRFDIMESESNKEIITMNYIIINGNIKLEGDTAREFIKKLGEMSMELREELHEKGFTVKYNAGSTQNKTYAYWR